MNIGLPGILLSAALLGTTMTRTAPTSYTIKVKVLGAGGKSVLVPEMSVKLEGEHSVFDASVDAFKKVKVQYDYSGVGNKVYIKAIDNLYQYEKGPQSGWLYKVNGEVPDEGPGMYTLKQGDIIEWVYTTNLGKDVGADYYKLLKKTNNNQ
ncbi:MAG: DUF4430 domain-containing protein [Cellulosilyticaceae bacterium]